MQGYRYELTTMSASSLVFEDLIVSQHGQKKICMPSFCGYCTVHVPFLFIKIMPGPIQSYVVRDSLN